MMRRTIHVGDLPSHTVLKRRRDLSDDVSGEEDEKAIDDSRKATIPDTTTKNIASVKDATSDDSSSDDDEELAQEKEKLDRARATAPPGRQGISSVNSWQSDVLFRRNVALDIHRDNDDKKSTTCRLQTTQQTDAHRNFMKSYFR